MVWFLTFPLCPADSRFFGVRCAGENPLIWLSFTIYIVSKVNHFVKPFSQKKGVISIFFWLFFALVIYFRIRKERSLWQSRKERFAGVSCSRPSFTRRYRGRQKRNIGISPALSVSPWKNIWKKKRGGKNRIGQQLFICIYIVLYYMYTNMYIL